jgi:hypothetical protein
MESVPGAVATRSSTQATVEIAKTVTQSLPPPVLTSSLTIRDGTVRDLHAHKPH